MAIRHLAGRAHGPLRDAVGRRLLRGHQPLWFHFARQRRPRGRPHLAGTGAFGPCRCPDALDTTAPVDQTDTWYRQLDVALQAAGISGLNEESRQAVISPAGPLCNQSAPVRLLHILRESSPLTAAGYEEDTKAALADLLLRAGFTEDLAQELQWYRIRWPLMSQEEFDRRDLNSLRPVLDPPTF